MDATLALDGDAALRTTSLGDAEELFALVDEHRATLREWMAWVDVDVDVRGTSTYLRASDERRVAGSEDNAVILSDGAIAGVIGLRAIDVANRAGEIGYWIAPPFEGRGLATEACRAVIDEAFTARGLHRISVACAVENVKSRAIPERLGFTLEGQLREAEWLGDRFVDHALYSVLSSEWNVR